jgi:hypothetical protein
LIERWKFAHRIPRAGPATLETDLVANVACAPAVPASASVAANRAGAGGSGNVIFRHIREPTAAPEGALATRNATVAGIHSVARRMNTIGAVMQAAPADAPCHAARCRFVPLGHARTERVTRAARPFRAVRPVPA